MDSQIEKLTILENLRGNILLWYAFRFGAISAVSIQFAFIN